MQAKPLREMVFEWDSSRELLITSVGRLKTGKLHREVTLDSRERCSCLCRTSHPGSHRPALHIPGDVKSAAPRGLEWRKPGRLSPLASLAVTEALKPACAPAAPARLPPSARKSFLGVHRWSVAPPRGRIAARGGHSGMANAVKCRMAFGRLPTAPQRWAHNILSCRFIAQPLRGMGVIFPAP